jgi:hypothetical protein
MLFLFFPLILVQYVFVLNQPCWIPCNPQAELIVFCWISSWRISLLCRFVTKRVRAWRFALCRFRCTDASKRHAPAKPRTLASLPPSFRLALPWPWSPPPSPLSLPAARPGSGGGGASRLRPRERARASPLSPGPASRGTSTSSSPSRARSSPSKGHPLAALLATRRSLALMCLSELNWSNYSVIRMLLVWLRLCGFWNCF